MKFSTKGLDTTNNGTVGSYLGWGIFDLKINSLEVKTSSTGSKKVILHMETPPVKIAKFKPAEGNTNGGQIGRVWHSRVWLKHEDQFKAFIKDMAQIADQLNTRAQFDESTEQEYSDFEALVQGIAPSLCNRFCGFKVAGQKYMTAQGDEKTMLILGRFNKDNVAVNKDKTRLKFNDKYDLTPVETPDNTVLDKADGTPDPFSS